MLSGQWKQGCQYLPEPLNLEYYDKKGMHRKKVFVGEGRHEEYKKQCLDYLTQNEMVTLSAVGEKIPKAVAVMQMVKDNFNAGYQVRISTDVSITANNKLKRASRIEISLFNEEKIGKEMLSLSHLLGKDEDYGCYMGCLPLPETSLDSFQSPN